MTGWDQLLVGIGMIKRLPLGTNDVEFRLMGIKGHQIAGLSIGLMGVTDALFLGGGLKILVLSGIAFLSAAKIGNRGTLGEIFVVASKYWSRSRAFSMNCSDLQRFELRQIGRLDLAGRDDVLFSSLAQMATGLSLEGDGNQFSVSVQRESGRTSTTLSTSREYAPAMWWTKIEADDTPLVGREGWSTLKVGNRYYSVLNFDDFTLANRRKYFFERFLAWIPSGVVITVFEVVGAQQGLKKSARAAHRLTIDSSITQAVGFRTSARTLTTIQRKIQQEKEVEAGATLMRIGVYMLCSGETKEQCLSRAKQCIDYARRTGLPLLIKYGQQGPLLEALGPRLNSG